MRKKRGIDQGYTCIPLVSILSSSLAWALGGSVIGPLAFVPAALDPGTWMLIGLPLAAIGVIRPTRNASERQPGGNAEPRSSGSGMNTATALRLLGPLASLAVQRQYIVEATDDHYILPSEILNNADYFIDHPQIGETAELPIVQELSRILNDSVQRIPLDDPVLTNEILIEQNPEWDRLRSAAKSVLLELGADVDEWERQQLEHSDA